MLGNREVIVFAIEHYNPLDMIRSLGVEGIFPIYIAEKGKSIMSSMSKYIKKTYSVDTVDEGFEVLMSYGSTDEKLKPIVLTADDRTQAYLDERYDEIKDRFILFNAKTQGNIVKYMNKFEILRLAKKHGLKTLESRVVENGELPDDLIYPIITKSISPVVGGWKSDVHICNDAGELKDAFSKIASPKVLLQRFIEKKNEYCVDGLAVDHGEVVYNTIASTYNYNIKGYYSPYMTVRPFANVAIQKALEGMMKEIGFEGIFSAEFLIDHNDEYYFSEINFRNSTWSYASTKCGNNLIYLWCKAMIEGSNCLENAKHDFEPFTAMVEPIDYQKRVVEGGMPLDAWVIELLACKCLYYFDKEDMEPFFQMIRDNEKLR